MPTHSICRPAYSQYGFGIVQESFDSILNQQLIERTQIAAITCLATLALTIPAVLAGTLSVTAIPLSAAMVTTFGGGYIYLCRFNYFSIPRLSPQLFPEKSFYDAPTLGEYRDNHTVTLAAHGHESAEWKLDFMRRAKQSLEFSGNFCGGPLFRKGLDNIRLAMRENSALKVHILTSIDFLEKEDKELLQELETEFPNRFHYLQTNRHLKLFPQIEGAENHVKLMVVDEEFFIIGGTGMQEAYRSVGDGSDSHSVNTLLERFLPNRFRDTDLLGKGEIAKTMRLEFFKLWAFWELRTKTDLQQNRYFPLNPNLPRAEYSFSASNNSPQNASVKFLASSPETAENSITDEYCRILDEAQEGEHISIANLLFNAPPILYQKIKAAAARGCKIDIVTNGLHSQASTANRFFCSSNRLGYYPLLKTGNVRIFEYNVPKTNLHKKILVTSREALIGSFNLSSKSHVSDQESAVVLRSHSLVEQLHAQIAIDQSYSQQVTLEDAQYWHSLRGGWTGHIQNALWVKILC